MELLYLIFIINSNFHIKEIYQNLNHLQKIYPTHFKLILHPQDSFKEGSPQYYFFYFEIVYQTVLS